MTPPKIPSLRLLQTDFKRTFFPELQLRLNPDLPSPLKFQPFSQTLSLGNYRLSWTAPTLWNRQLNTPPIQVSAPTKSEAPRVENKSLSGEQTWALVENILGLMETLDARGTRMISNGGKGGCRFEEMAQRSEVDKLKDKCVVKFEEDTHANVDLQVRKKKGSDESLITQFRVTYDKNIFKDEWPDNNVRVLGFQFTPLPVKPIPFYQEIDPLTARGYSIRYMVIPHGLLQIPFIGYPVFKGVAESSDKLDLTHDFLAALGIEKPEYFQEADTEEFKIPQLVSGFLKILHHIEPDDDKLSVVNINKLRGGPKLFDWLSFEKIDWVAHLKAGSLNIPNFGYFTFSRDKAQEKLSKTTSADDQHKILEESSRFEIHGGQKELTASFFNPEIKEARFSIGQHEVTLKGLTAGKISSTLPGLKKLIAKIGDGKFSLEDLGIFAEDLQIQEISIYDAKNNIRTKLKNAHIKKFSFDGLSNIKAEGVSADSFDIDSPKLAMGLHIRHASIPSIRFEQKSDRDSLSITRIEGNNTRLDYSSTHLTSEKSVFENLRWIESKGKSRLEIQSLRTSGSFEYQAPSGISFSTAGSSHLDNIALSYEKTSKDVSKLSAAFDISGLIKQLNINERSALKVQLANTEFNPSHISVDLALDAQDNSLRNIHYDIDLHIEKTEIEPSQLGPVSTASSTIRQGRIHLVQSSDALFQLPQIDISGILGVHIQEIKGNNESFNIPGLSVTGGIYGIDLEGPAHFKTTPQGWLFEKLPTATDEKLHAKAQIKEVDLSHDPHKIPGNDLRQWINNQVVKTQMKFNAADFEIDDIREIEFVNGQSETVNENHLRNMELRNIRFTNIQAAGVAWAKFPLFYYMRGVFPEIGTRYQDTVTSPSFLSLDRFSISSEAGSKAVTTFEGFRSEIYEIGGESKFAKVNIPLLRITPENENIIDTGDNPNEIDLYLIDKPRGGYIHLRSAPRPLEKRHSRIIPPPK